MQLAPLPTADSWPEEIAELAREELTGSIRVIKAGAAASYDPVTDTQTFSASSVIIPTRPARIQHLGLSEAVAGEQWLTKRRFRFQIDLIPGDPLIEKGMQVQIIDGDGDPSLNGKLVQILSAVNSSRAALRTIEGVL